MMESLQITENKKLNSVSGSKENFEYETYIVPNLKPYIIDLIKQIAPELQNNTYGLIVIDDVSGRVPGLIVRGVVNSILASKNLPRLLALGIKPKSLDYLNTSQAQKSLSQSQGFLKKYKEEIGKKILFVSEALNTGTNYNITERFFDSLGLDFDLITLTSLYPVEKYKTKNTNKIYTANIQWFESPHDAVGMLPDNTSLSGFTRGDAGKSFLLQGEGQKFIKKQTRKDINTLVSEIGYDLEQDLAKI